MSPELEKYLEDWKEYIYHKNNYTIEEREVFMKSFKERLYRLNGKPLVI